MENELNGTMNGEPIYLFTGFTKVLYNPELANKDTEIVKIKGISDNMKNELNYLRDKMNSCQYELDMHSSLRHPDSYTQNKIKSLTKEVKLLNNILNALTINELK